MIIAKILLLFSLFQSPDLVNQVEIDSLRSVAKNELVVHDSLFTNTEVGLDLESVKGWRISTEDNPAFARTDFDDSHWYALSNSLYETQLPDSLWQGFGWLRLHIRIDSSFSKQLNVINPIIMGASELYINGKLVLQRGVPGVTPDQEKLMGSIMQSGIPYEFLPGSTYVLAVRYSLHNYKAMQHLSLGSYYSQHLLSVVITNYETYNDHFYSGTQLATTTFSFAAAILLMVMALHLFMHLSVADEKANLAILVLSACLFLLSLSLILMGFSIKNFWIYIFNNSIKVVLMMGISSLIPWVTHLVLGVPVSVFWKRFAFTSVVLVMILGIFPELIFNAFIIPLILFALIIVTVTGSIVATIKARRLKRSGIGLIVGSLIIYPIMFIIVMVLSSTGFAYPWNLIVIFFMLISMPVGMSIRQAQQFLKLHVHLDSLVRDRTAELNKSLNDLKSTQSQLIQSEKMASLGELTAGIAHEIQNPLNFVNNFSEVSTELIDEMKEELAVGSLQSAVEIADDLKKNLEKINHHGKRAGDIVKGMLQHSRTSSGQKELTDINALADEYLRLAYHGLRAKDKSFNATMKTDFDETIGNINVVPQDMGRVILNLITNAFYVVNERAKSNQPGYEPTVSITTKKEGSTVLIVVKDNGNGIPDKIKEKIFQPFFTTKPTGQGTGLGLSLSYDIVKAHSGELKVVTKEGEGSEFSIVLPV